MFNSLWVAKTGMEAQDFRVSTISSNLANASTTGFKKDLAHFANLEYSHIRGQGGKDEQGNVSGNGILSIGHGVEVSDTSKVFTQGSPKQTDVPTDFMIQGEGFFVLADADGTNVRYTRDGHFSLEPVAGGWSLVHVASDKHLVASPTDFAAGAYDPTGPVPPNIITLTTNTGAPPAPRALGTLTYDSSTGELKEMVGGSEYSLGTSVYIPLAKFGAMSGLKPEAGNLFKDEVDQTGGATYFAGAGSSSNGYGAVLQNKLENSNVTTIDEMVDMIEAQRGYEMGAKVMEKTDEMMSTLIQRT